MTMTKRDFEMIAAVINFHGLGHHDEFIGHLCSNFKYFNECFDKEKFMEACRK